MEIKFTLSLPRDTLSVPVVRRVLNSSMATLGVAEDCLTDIEIALTEACTNVLDHAAQGDEYEVTAGLDDSRCVIEVVDTGRGFDAEGLGHAEAHPSAEEGRGILGVVDGFSPKGVEDEGEVMWRKDFLRRIGYKL